MHGRRVMARTEAIHGSSFKKIRIRKIANGGSDKGRAFGFNSNNEKRLKLMSAAASGKCK